MLSPTKYCVQQTFGSKEKFGPKKVLGPKIFWVPKNIWSNEYESPKLFGSEQILSKQNLGPQKFGSNKIILCQKKRLVQNVELKNVGPKIMINLSCRVGWVGGWSESDYNATLWPYLAS